MTRLRLSPAVSIVPVGTTVVIRSDLGMFKLEGGDLSLFLERLTPLLRDGAADLDAIVAALPEFDAQSVRAVLDLLGRYGVVEPEGDPEQRRWYGQTAFLQKWTGNGAAAQETLRRSRVLIVALEPVGMLAALELAASGVGAIHIADDDVVSERDLPFVRGLRGDHVGRPRREVLQEMIRDEAPWCDCTIEPLRISDDRVLVAAGDFNLALTAAAEDDLLVFRAVAAFAHERKMWNLSATLRDVEALIGPLVFPGSACWNCTRLRMLSNSDAPGTEHSLHSVLLRRRSAPRARTYLTPMPSFAAGAVATEIIAALTSYTSARLAGRLMVMNLRTFETTFHAVVRMPWCAICGGAAGGENQPGTPLPPGGMQTPEEVRAALGGWVDERVGVVRYVSAGGGEARDPELPVTASALLSSYAEETYHEHEAQVGSGKGLTAAEAMIGAIGEATERYSAARFRRHELRRAPLQEAGPAAIDPRDLVLYSEEQYRRDDFPFTPFRSDQPIDWCDAWWLDDRSPALAPALPTYFDFQVPPAERFCQVSSNGLAAGASLDDAALRATWELIERDAFMLTWLARLPARRIECGDDLDSMLGEVLRQLRECGAEAVELYLLDAGIDVPTVACLAFGDGQRWPAVTAALAAHPDGPTSVRKAILEQGHVGPYVRRLMSRGERVPEMPDDVRTLTDHALYYAPPSRRSAFDFLRNGASIRLCDLPRDPSPAAATTIAALRRAGVRVAIADVTSPDTRLGPFRVARALGLRMQPIHFGHTLVRSENPRLRALTAALNPDPHPLA